MLPVGHKPPGRQRTCFRFLLLVIFVHTCATSPTLLDRFAASFQHHSSPAAGGSVIPDSLPLPPIGVDQPDPCYDQENSGRARRCAPDFVNAAFGRQILASSTCGEAGPSRYCVTSATSRRASSSKSCHVCDAADVKLSHPASHLTDLNNPNNVTCWMSEPVPPAANHNISLTLSLGKKFEVVAVYCTTCN